VTPDLPGAGEQVLLAGLGNPGPRYAANRHNVGFMVLDELAARVGGKFKAHKGGAEVLEGRLAGRRVVLAKPRSFMNLSGGPVSGTAKFYKIEPSGVVVIHDGLRSISKSLATKDYYRVRFGIGRPPGRMDPADFVLKDFATVERKELPFEVDRCADAVEALIGKGLTAAQNAFHAG
jgi:PTH1 family peptidyl-tRNA hydrolase